MSKASPAALVLFVIALTAAVALTSDGSPVWTLLREGRADRLVVLRGVISLCVVGLVVAGTLVAVIHRTLYGGHPEAPPLKTALIRALPVTAAAITVAGLLAIGESDLGYSPHRRADPTHAMEDSGRRGIPLTINWWESKVRAGEGQDDEQVGGEAESDPRSGLPLALLVGVALFAAAGAGLAWARRHLPTVPAGPEEGAADKQRKAFHGTFVGTIDAMLDDPDPNTAIRGAYARLLEGLAASGTARRPHEAPMEHLHRVLTVCDVRPQPLRELVDLFAVARFSTHLLNASHRERALAALEAVAHDLADDSRRPAWRSA